MPNRLVSVRPLAALCRHLGAVGGDRVPNQWETTVGLIGDLRVRQRRLLSGQREDLLLGRREQLLVELHRRLVRLGWRRFVIGQRCDRLVLGADIPHHSNMGVDTGGDLPVRRAGITQRRLKNGLFGLVE
jgi:hypothetical protein